MTTKNELLKAIRKQCLECWGQSRNAKATEGTAAELVRECDDKECSLYPYRFGVDPNITPGASLRGATVGREHGFGSIKNMREKAKTSNEIEAEV